ncbi:MAG TPA: hypothetical protein VK131_02080 [Candidatus Acidoferrales bacterium]|nr:hypothetical protein [Candidatus Acidoferrales bacterium]
MGDRCILAVKYTAVAAPGALGRAVGGFLRYIHYRDRHQEEEAEPDPQVAGLLKYVAHRDRAASRARLFDRTGLVGDEERRQLALFAARSVAGTRPQLVRGSDGQLVDRRRAVYRFVLSPERAEGLDLRRLTQAVMEQLEGDVGGQLRWIAAEHRNTAHPHVHLVVAVRRELPSGGFRGVMLTRPRLARMKEALALELELQRQHQAQPPGVASRRPDGPRPPADVRRREGTTIARVRWAPAPHRRPDTRSPQRVHSRSVLFGYRRALRRLASRYRWEAEREAVEAQRRDRGWSR